MNNYYKDMVESLKIDLDKAIKDNNSNMINIFSIYLEQAEKEYAEEKIAQTMKELNND